MVRHKANEKWEYTNLNKVAVTHLFVIKINIFCKLIVWVLVRKI